MPKKDNAIIERAILDNVRNYIKENGISIKDLANSMGLKYDQLFQKLYNRESIDISTYIQICCLLDVSPDYFVKDLFTFTKE